jgi:hypothetical protein
LTTTKAFPPPRARAQRGLSVGALALATLTACNIPTDVPILDSRWVVPAEETKFGVSELLPGDVTLTPDSSAFLVNFYPVSFSATLGSLCTLCVATNGLNVPKPPFTGNIVSAIDFPPEVSAVTIIDGQVDLSIHNGLNFDPLRPSASARGSIVVTLTDDADGDTLGTLTIDGNTTAMAPGATLLRTVILNPGTINGSLAATATVDSPLGDNVTINTSLGVSVTATPANVRVASVKVDVANRSVSVGPDSLDVADVDQNLTNKLQAGAFVLDVTNPFGVGAAFQLTITGTGVPTLHKSANVGPQPTSTVRVDFTVSELQSFLGHGGVTLSGTGVVDPAAGPITVTPGQELVLKANFDFTIRLGE